MDTFGRTYRVAQWYSIMIVSILIFHYPYLYIYIHISGVLIIVLSIVFSIPFFVPSGSEVGTTLPQTNMETPKRPYKDYSLPKRGLYGFPCYFGGV